MVDNIGLGSSGLSSRHLPVWILLISLWLKLTFLLCFSCVPSDVAHDRVQEEETLGQVTVMLSNCHAVLIDAGPLGWMPMPDCTRMQGSELDVYSWPRALDAGQRVLHAGPITLDEGTIWQDIQGYISRFWAAIAVKNAGHCRTPTYGDTAASHGAATTLCPNCLAANPSSACSGAGRLGKPPNIVYYRRQYCTTLKTLYFKKKTL